MKNCVFYKQYIYSSAGKVRKYFFEHFSHFPGNVVQVAPVYQRSAIVPHNSCAFKDPILMGNLHSSTMPFYVL